MLLTIRPYVPADLEAVVSLWLASWESTGVMPVGTIPIAELSEKLPREIAGGWEVHVAIQANEIVGFLAQQGDTLEQLFIAPAHQRRGLGRRMLDFVKCARPGGFTLTTASPSRAWRFYEREGLTRAGAETDVRWGPQFKYVWKPSKGNRANAALASPGVLRIRPYVVGDLEAVAALWVASWNSTGVAVQPASALPSLRAQFAEEVARGWAIHVAMAGGEIVGFCALDDDELERLFVAPRQQGRGLGKQLLDFVKRLRPSGFTLTTAADSRAPAFYEREGLIRTGIEPNPRYAISMYRYNWLPK